MLLLVTPFDNLLADEVPTASASVQQTAIEDALLYAQSPQLDLHAGRSTEPSARSTSIATMTRKIAQIMVHTMWDNMRQRAEQESETRLGSGISTTYDLRLSDDRILLRMRRRF